MFSRFPENSWFWRCEDCAQRRRNLIPAREHKWDWWDNIKASSAVLINCCSAEKETFSGLVTPASVLLPVNEEPSGTQLQYKAALGAQQGRWKLQPPLSPSRSRPSLDWIFKGTCTQYKKNPTFLPTCGLWLKLKQGSHVRLLFAHCFKQGVGRLWRSDRAHLHFWESFCICWKKKKRQNQIN